MKLKHYQGDQLPLDVTPSTAIAAGDGDTSFGFFSIAGADIAANKRGEVFAPSGTAVYLVGEQLPLVTGDGISFSKGDKLYWDTVEAKFSSSATSNVFVGTITELVSDDSDENILVGSKVLHGV